MLSESIVKFNVVIYLYRPYPDLLFYYIYSLIIITLYCIYMGIRATQMCKFALQLYPVYIYICGEDYCAWFMGVLDYGSWYPGFKNNIIYTFSYFSESVLGMAIMLLSVRKWYTSTVIWVSALIFIVFSIFNLMKILFSLLLLI